MLPQTALCCLKDCQEYEICGSAHHQIQTKYAIQRQSMIGTRDRQAPKTLTLNGQKSEKYSGTEVEMET